MISTCKRCALAVLAFLLCAGCQPTPKIEYAVSQAPDYSGALKFTLARTAIKLDYGRSGDGKTEDRMKVIATVVPMEDESRVFTMTARVEDLWSITTISASFAGDTRLFKSIGSDVQSKTDDLIKNVGAVLTTLAPLIAFADSGPELKGDLPDVIDVSSSLTSAQPGDVVISNKLINGANYELKIAPVSKDAIVTEEFLVSPQFRSRGPIIFFSACRSATLTLPNFPVGKTSRFSFKIVDPKFVQTLALPAKGNVTFHDTCGVDLATQRSDAPSGDKLLSDLVSQVKAIIDAKNSPPSKTK